MSKIHTILIVEDDVWQAEHFERQLKRSGYEVKIAYNAFEAMRAIDSSPPDVIILDILLPGANGIALLHEIRSYSDSGGIPVIMCSSLAEALPAKQLEAYGVSTVIDKTTIKTDELVAAVEGVLR